MRADTGGQRRWAGGLGAGVSILSRAVEALIGLLLAGVVVIILVEIFFRAIRYGVPWTDEAARYLQIWLGYLGGAVAVHRWSHFQLDILERVTPRPIQRVLRIFSSLIVVSTGGVMLYYGNQERGIAALTTSPTLNLNMGLVESSVMVGGLLIMIFGIPHLLAAIRGQPLVNVAVITRDEVLSQ
jgi:TRAP-type C4-dicarboxylate transport system permease small subunit